MVSRPENTGAMPKAVNNDIKKNKKKVPYKERAGFFMDMNDSSLQITN
jgi:hypothetical protein